MSKNGFQFYVHFVDEYSQFTWIYFLKTKVSVLQAFEQFKAQVELQTDHKIKVLQNAWGGEF